MDTTQSDCPHLESLPAGELVSGMAGFFFLAINHSRRKNNQDSHQVKATYPDTKIFSRSYPGSRIYLEGIVVLFSKHLLLRAELIRLLDYKGQFGSELTTPNTFEPSQY